MPQLADPHQDWTLEDLRRLALTDAETDLDWRRFEIVDGALVVSPSASRPHEVISARLLAALAPAVPRGYDVVGPFWLDLSPSYRVPDLLVIPSVSADPRSDIARPAEVLLAVEIVSPSSRTTDRITKPAQYAAAGIPAYWRVETDPQVTLTAYTLSPDAGVYSELGTWGPGQTVDLDTPFAVHIRIDTLVLPG